MHTTHPTTTIPAVAAGHRNVAFCNVACQACDDEMTTRSLRIRRADRLGMQKLMATAPTGR